MNNILIYSLKDEDVSDLIRKLSKHFQVQTSRSDLNQIDCSSYTDVIGLYRKPIENLLSKFWTPSNNLEPMNQLINNFNNNILTYKESTEWDVTDYDKISIGLNYFYKKVINNTNYYIINAEYQDSAISFIFNIECCLCTDNTESDLLKKEFIQQYKLPEYVFDRIFDPTNSPTMYKLCTSQEIHTYKSEWQSRLVPSSIKTLIGKDDFLFLVNDANHEIEQHYGNLTRSPINPDMIRAIKNNFTKYMLINIPDKCLIYKNYLPNYVLLTPPVRRGLDLMRSYLDDHILDMLPQLENKDMYYKTDTHINMNGLVCVYENTIDKINSLFNQHIECKRFIIKLREAELSFLQIGFGDLTWESNKGDLIVNPLDHYYYTDTIRPFYYKYELKNKNSDWYDLQLFDYEFNNQTQTLSGQIVSWNILSDYILITKNPSGYGLKVIIFYDSMLTLSLDLWMQTFRECIFCKSILNESVVTHFNHDLILQFNIERFL